MCCLSPGIDVRLERVAFAADVLEVSAATCGPAPRCPGCWARARRVHSSYGRRLAERPLTGPMLQVRLRVRRFFCDWSSCKRKTFVEQVSGLSERYRRSSIGTKQWLHAVAVELGGRAGERLCRQLRLSAGRSSVQALVVGGLLGQVAKAVSQPGVGEADPVPGRGKAQQDLGDGQAQQFAVRQFRGSPDPATRGHMVVDEHVQCRQKGVQVCRHTRANGRPSPWSRPAQTSDPIV